MARTTRTGEWEYHLGEQICVGDVTVTPQSRALAVRGSSGGLVWNRPAALLVRRNDEERRIPIVDVTRLLQMALFGVAGIALGISVAVGVMRGWEPPCAAGVWRNVGGRERHE